MGWESIPFRYQMKRCSGVLMPIFSLPSKYGIGGFGKESFNFIDFLRSAGQKVWQILPLVQTGYGNSPYSSVSSKSFNPYFISPEILVKEGLLTEDEAAFSERTAKYIDYGELYNVRYPLLRKAFSRFDCDSKEFCDYKKSKESYDYALFMALKYQSGQKHFYHWEDGYKFRSEEALSRFADAFSDELDFWQFVQFEAKTQWLSVKEYANKKGVSIVGDMPLYVALDSVDVWVNPELFKLDENFNPKKVAGVPPDYFCEDGQLWGNPVYDYAKHKEDDFYWWTDRITQALSIYDYVRIDHFRGLDRYYEVDSFAKTAKVGEWVDVPSKELFSAIHKKVDKSKIIAEDLGVIDDGVRTLLKNTGYPGMKILSFAFNGDKNNLYLPENIEKNSVCYTGTHDNDTLKGLIENFSEWDFNNFKTGVKSSLETMALDGEINTVEGLIDAVINLGFNSRSNLFILPLQDLLKLGSEYRINEPGRIKNQNWSIRFEKEDMSKEVARRLKELCKKYNR